MGSIVFGIIGGGIGAPFGLVNAGAMLGAEIGTLIGGALAVKYSPECQGVASWGNKMNPYRNSKYHVYDPLALDLDGDGIETVATKGFAGALFDHRSSRYGAATFRRLKGRHDFRAAV